MGLMDKFKNLFTDEEIVEEDDDEQVEIKEVKKEEKSKLPTFMREKIAKEEPPKEDILSKIDIADEEIKKEIKIEKNLDDTTDDILSEEKQNFKFPIDLNDDDFVETRESRQSLHAKEKVNEIIEQHDYPTPEPREKAPLEPLKHKKELKVADIYKDKREEKKEPETSFRATPIISPIYGVLDKNYDSTYVGKGRNFEDARPSKSVDFDSVRKKAYGNLSKEIKENLMCENCEYLKEAKECQEKRAKEFNEEEEYEDITIDEATENYYDYGVEYEKKNTPNDNYYLDEEDDTEDIKIVNHNDEEEQPKKNEIPPVKSSINLLSTIKKSMGDEEEKEEPKEKDLELTDDLFNLIDSMYDERNDNKWLMQLHFSLWLYTF